MLFKSILIPIFCFSAAFAADYKIVNFLDGQREIVPRNHLKMMIESKYRVDFRKLSCDSKSGVFTPYLFPKNRNNDSLILLGDGKKTILKFLKYLNEKSPNAAELIRRLKSSPHKVYAEISKSRNFVNLKVFDKYEHNNAHGIANLESSFLMLEHEKVPLNQLGGSSIITWNPSLFGNSKMQAIALAHELYHAYDAARGLLDFRLVTGKGYETADVREYRAVYFENLVRKDLGVKPRLRYSESSEGTLKNLWVNKPCLKE